jgi:tetratricopeptide (TPR) repeat protein
LVEELVRRGVFEGTDDRFDFTHDRIRAVISADLLLPQRKVLHRQIGAALETVHADDLGTHSAALATHYRAGEVWDKAVDFSRQAAVRATDRSAYSQAVAHTDQALEALARLPEGRQTLELAFEIRTEGARYAALWSIGQQERALENAREALALAERLGDQHRLARSLDYLGNAVWMSGENVRALEFCQRASEIAAALEDTAVQVVSTLDLGAISNSLGDYRSAVAFLQKNRGILRGDVARNRFGRTFYPSVTTRCHLARSLAELGEFSQAIAVAEEGLQIAEDLGHLGSILVAQSLASEVLIRRSEFGDAILRLERCLSLALPEAFAAIYPAIAGWLGHAYAMTGRADEGLSLLEPAAKRAGRAHRPFEVLVTAYLGEAYLLAGRRDDARAAAERALSLARERSDRGGEARALSVLGEIATHHDPPEVESAEQHYRQALALAEDLGMRPLIAHCHLGLGKLYRRTGKREQAQEHLTTATTMYRDMGMTYWLEKTETAMSELA